MRSGRAVVASVLAGTGVVALAGCPSPAPRGGAPSEATGVGTTGDASASAVARVTVNPTATVSVNPSANPAENTDAASPPAAGKGKACKTARDCAGGEACHYDEGCGAGGTCGAAHPCTRDRVAYCGCDGKTTHGSSSCPPAPFAHRGTCEGGPKKACTSNAQCAAGEECQGPDTCGSVWTCGALRRCTRDLVEFCGCDGQVFRGSSTCPQRPYRRRGRC